MSAFKLSWVQTQNSFTFVASSIPLTDSSCLCSSDLPSSAELFDSADDELFHSILYNPHHVLRSTLPKETGYSHGLRRRRHNRELLSKSSRLVQSCFLVRMLYKDIYWLFRFTSFCIHIIVTLYTLRFVKVLLKFYWLIDWIWQFRGANVQFPRFDSSIPIACRWHRVLWCRKTHLAASTSAIIILCITRQYFANGRDLSACAWGKHKDLYMTQ